MKACVHSRQCCRCIHRLRLLSNYVFFFGFLQMATAQSTIPSTSLGVSATSHSPSPQTTLSTVVSGAMSFALLASSNSSSTSTHPTPTDDAPPTTPLTTGAAASSSSDADDNSQQDRDDGLLNYYFIFLALLVILLLIGIWYVHRRKKQRKARLRNSGQNALARDLNGWNQPRRWMHGVAPWRTEGLDTHRDEGLNELGEAPPAYTKDMGTAERRASASSTLAEASDPPPEPAIPLRTLARDESDRLRIRPPGYEESIRDSLTPTSAHSRPGSVFPSTSTEDIHRSEPQSHS